MRRVPLARTARFRLATSRVLDRTVHAAPPLEARAWRSARRYVGGRTADEALAVARSLHAAGLASSIDLFGERVTDDQEAHEVAVAYVSLARRLRDAPPGVWLSLDLSHIAFDLGLATQIAEAVPAGRRLQLGAEEAETAGRTVEAACRLAGRGLPVGATLQANLLRSTADADRLAAAGIPVRLVKGAYVERADVARPWGRETDVAYAMLAHRLSRQGAELALATHDRPLRERLLADLPAGVGCELLLGVHPEQASELVARGRHVRIYVPYGDGWLRYLLRRRAEAVGA
jgi:proline dehydrogenase